MSKGPKLGIAGALEILEGLEPDLRERILSEIQAREPQLFDRLKQGLLNIEALLKLEDADLQELLREIPREKWARALRATSPELKERILQSMPSRARTDLEELIVSIGPQPLSEVRRIQSEIVLVAQARMESRRPR